MSRINKYIDDGIVALHLFVRNFPDNVDKILCLLFAHCGSHGRHFFPITNKQKLAYRTSSAKLTNSTHKPGGTFPMVKGSDKTEDRDLTHPKFICKSGVSCRGGELANIYAIGDMEEFFRICFPRFQVLQDRLRYSDNRIGALHHIVFHSSTQPIAEGLCFAGITSIFPECPQFIDESRVRRSRGLKRSKSAEHRRVCMNYVDGMLRNQLENSLVKESYDHHLPEDWTPSGDSPLGQQSGIRCAIIGDAIKNDIRSLRVVY